VHERSSSEVFPSLLCFVSHSLLTVISCGLFFLRLSVVCLLRHQRPLRTHTRVGVLHSFTQSMSSTHTLTCRCPSLTHTVDVLRSRTVDVVHSQTCRCPPLTHTVDVLRSLTQSTFSSHSHTVIPTLSVRDEPIENFESLRLENVTKRAEKKI